MLSPEGVQTSSRNGCEALPQPPRYPRFGKFGIDPTSEDLFGKRWGVETHRWNVKAAAVTKLLLCGSLQKRKKSKRLTDEEGKPAGEWGFETSNKLSQLTISQQSVGDGKVFVHIWRSKRMFFFPEDVSSMAPSVGGCDGRLEALQDRRSRCMFHRAWMAWRSWTQLICCKEWSFRLGWAMGGKNWKAQDSDEQIGLYDLRHRGSTGFRGWQGHGDGYLESPVRLWEHPGRSW